MVICVGLSYNATNTMDSQNCDLAVDQITLLHSATAGNNIAQLNELKKQSSLNLNTQNKVGQTACHIAVEHEALDALRWLHAAGADINIYDKRGGAPLHWAIIKGKPKIVHQLLMLGAKLDMPTKESEFLPSKIKRNLPGASLSTPFHVAAYRNDPTGQDIKKILLLHALFTGTQNIHQLHDPRLDLTISCKSEAMSARAFVEIFCSSNKDLVNTARTLLYQRAKKLEELLSKRDSHYNTSPEIEEKINNSAQHELLFRITNLQLDMENFILSVQAGAVTKLDSRNIFKAAHDAMEDHAPSNCVIC